MEGGRRRRGSLPFHLHQWRTMMYKRGEEGGRLGGGREGPGGGSRRPVSGGGGDEWEMRRGGEGVEIRRRGGRAGQGAGGGLGTHTPELGEGQVGRGLDGALERGGPHRERNRLIVERLHAQRQGQAIA